MLTRIFLPPRYIWLPKHINSCVWVVSLYIYIYMEFIDYLWLQAYEYRLKVWINPTYAKYRSMIAWWTPVMTFLYCSVLSHTFCLNLQSDCYQTQEEHWTSCITSTGNNQLLFLFFLTRARNWSHFHIQIQSLTSCVHCKMS